MYFARPIFTLLLNILVFSSALGQSVEEKELINFLNTYHTNIYKDSISDKSDLEAFTKNLENSLTASDISSFKNFKTTADSLNVGIEIKKSVDDAYELFTLNTNMEHWNYILKNKKILYKADQTFTYFYEVQKLDANHFLIIEKKPEMSYSCYEAFVFSDFNDNTSFQGKKVLSVCSWTHVDNSFSYNDKETGLTKMEGGVVHYTAKKINFNPKTKVISYSFSGLDNGKAVTRTVRYKNGTFKIKSHDVRDFID